MCLSLLGQKNLFKQVVNSPASKSVWKPIEHTVNRRPINLLRVMIHQMQKCRIKSSSNEEIREAIIGIATETAIRKQNEHMATSSHPGVITLEYAASLGSVKNGPSTFLAISMVAKFYTNSVPGLSMKTMLV